MLAKKETGSKKEDLCEMEPFIRKNKNTVWTLEKGSL